MNFKDEQSLIKEYQDTRDRVLKSYLTIKELKQQLNEEIDNYQRDRKTLIGLYWLINKSDLDKRENFITSLDLILEDIDNP